MKKRTSFIFALFIVLIFSGSHVNATKNNLLQEIGKLLPADSNIVFSVFSIEDELGLYFIDYPTPEEEQILSHILIAGTHGIDKVVTTIYIYKITGESVFKVWESPQLPGTFNRFTAFDFNQVGKFGEIIIETKNMFEDNMIFQLWIISWNGSETYMYSPGDIENNPLTSNEAFIPNRINYSDNTFIVIKYYEDNVVCRQYFQAEKNKVRLEKEEIKSQGIKPKTVYTDEKVDTGITNFMAKNYNQAEYIVYDLKHTGYYLIETDSGKMVVQKHSDDKVKELYKLGPRFSSMIYNKNFNLVTELNHDEYPELVLLEDAGNAVYCYILTLRPTAFELISPVGENGLSHIWTKLSYLEYKNVENGDILIETCVGNIEEYDFTSEYWKWSALTNMFTKIKK